MLVQCWGATLIKLRYKQGESVIMTLSSFFYAYLSYYYILLFNLLLYSILNTLLCLKLLKKPIMINYFYSSDFFYNSILPSVITPKIQLNYISSLKTSNYLLSNLIQLHNISSLNNENYVRSLKRQQSSCNLFIMELQSLNFKNNILINSKS